MDCVGHVDVALVGKVLPLIRKKRVSESMRLIVRLRVLFISCLLMFVLLPTFGRANELCYSFLFHGDVITRCNGRLRQITFTGDVLSFSIDDGGQFLATTHIRDWKNVSGGAAMVKVANLETGVLREVPNTGVVIPSCGTLVLLNYRTREFESHDLEQSPLVLLGAPLSSVRCSSDRSVVVGQLPGRPRGYPQQLFRHPDLERSVGTSGPEEFNISPDGLHVAYYGSELCLRVLAESAALCADVGTNMNDTPSVKNGGEVLVGFGDYEGRGCFYKTPTNFDTRKLPGRPFGEDACVSIGYWHPGLTRIQTLEPIGRNPQWISESTALKIRIWGERIRKGVNVK